MKAVNLRAKAAGAPSAFRAWLLSRRSIDSLRCALTFCTGTLLSIVPGYAGMWSSPLSLADQISFTLLGGVSKPVGGCWEQIYYRYVGGTVLSIPCYILLALLGKQYTIQGLLFAIFVFLLSWVGQYSRFVGGGALFAQTACAYAVTNSYRMSGEFGVVPLWDLLKCWSFGVAITLFYNFVFFPKFASSALQIQLNESLRTIQMAIDFLYSDKPLQLSAEEIHNKLLQESDAIAVLHRYAGWEIVFEAATWSELQVTVNEMNKLRVILATSVIDRCAYRMLTTDVAGFLHEPVRAYHAACCEVVELIRAGFHHQEGQKQLSEDPASVAQLAFTSASARLTEKMLASLVNIRQCNPADVGHVHIATHCISLAGPLATSLNALAASVTVFAHKPKGLQLRVLQSMEPLSDYVGRLRRWNRFLASAEVNNPFLPAPSIAQKALRILTTDEAMSSLKITMALVAMLAILWSPTSRGFFLDKNVQTATVPIILALMPTLGGSMLAWTAELLGTFSGAIWAFVTLLVWRGVGGATVSIPGVIFFQLLYTLCLSWRLAWEVDDMLGVLGCFAFAAYANKAYHLRESNPPYSLAEGLGNSCIVICIAIGIAIPLQFLVLRRNARQVLRLDLADSMRDVCKIQSDFGELFGRYMVDSVEESAAALTACSALRIQIAGAEKRLLALGGHVESAQAEWGTHDGWSAKRFVRQVAACQRVLAGIDIGARILSMGPFCIPIRSVISPQFPACATKFSSSTAAILWCHSAALALLQPLPLGLPLINDRVEELMSEVEVASERAKGLEVSAGGVVETDLRRFWQLSHLLISQGSNLQELEDLLSVDWKPKMRQDVEQLPLLALEKKISDVEALPVPHLSRE